MHTPPGKPKIIPVKRQPAPPPAAKKSVPAAPKATAKPVALRKLAVVEESTIAGMAVNAEFLKEFPFLSAIGRTIKSENGKPRGCGGCGRAAQERTAVFTAAKQAFASLDATKKRRLKELLKAQQVRITYMNNSGKVVQLTF